MSKLTLTLMFLSSIAHAQGPIRSLSGVLQGTGASGVVMDVVTGDLVARYGAPEAVAAPGSTLKPFVLKTALDAGVTGERESVHCTGKLTIRGHDLACTHPRDMTVLDARLALADSCNTYFASLARRMTATLLVSGLRGYGLNAAGALLSPDDRALLALGLVGVRATPMQMAAAYRKLAQQMNEQQRAAVVVREGMVQSVETGMAHGAHVDGRMIGGKTGTAQDAGAPSNGYGSHGWFAGILFDGQGKAQQVMVVYLPHGNGNDAALLAKKVIEREAGR